MPHESSAPAEPFADGAKPSDEELLRAFREQGSQSAFAALVERHSRVVRAACRRLLGRNHPLIDDATQAVFLVLAKKAHGMKSAHGLVTWLHNTARYVTGHVRREEQRRRRREQVAAPKSVVADEQEEEQIIDRELDVAIAHLSSRQREIVLRHYLEGQSHAAIAGELGLSVGAVKKRASDALSALRTFFTQRGVVSATALTLFFAAETSASAPKLAIATAGSTAAKLSSGVIKSMFLKTVIGLATAATLVIGTGAIATVSLRGAETPAAAPAGKRTGPLANLPSKPGATVEKIKALGDNQWITIGSPDADPKYGKGRGRSWGAKMVYAPDLQGAFLAGQGEHGFVKPDGRYDDLFFYDINANKWICLDPGFDTNTFADDIKKGEILVNDDFQLVRKDGNVVYHFGAHMYQNNTYDSDQKKYFCAYNDSGLCSDQFCRSFPWYVAALPLINERLAGKTERVVGMPYLYDTKTGKLERPGTAGARPRCGDPAGVVFYLPTKKCMFMYNQEDKLHFYDPATRQMSNADGKGPMPLGIDFGACYDSKRDRVCIAGGNYRPPLQPGEGFLYIYDVKTNTWSNIPNKGKTLAELGHFNANVTCMHYDSASDRILCFQHVGGGGTGVYIFDPETSTWSDDKLSFNAGVPADGGCWSGFYSPEHNAHFFHVATDSADNGTMWVYRYKKASKTGK